MNVSYGSGGSDAFSGGANASGSNTDSESYSKTHINSTINAGSLTSTSDNLTLSGANVEIAGNIDIETGNLLIESVQDVATSSSKTEGYNVSGSMGADAKVSPGSVGANQNNSNSDSQWVNSQTTLIGGTSGTGEVNISADKTTVRGAVVASATKNENGTLTDNNNLTLITDELIVEDIQDKNHSESEGFNVSTSGYSGTGSTTVGLTSNGHETEQTTFATLGGGNITKKDGSAHNTDGINRDLNNSQQVTKDQQTAGLDATVTVDHRLASEEGRQNIAENFEDTAEHGQDIARAAGDVVQSDALNILNFGEALHNNAMATQLKNDLVRNPENAQILAGLKSDNPEEYAQAKQQLAHLAQEKFGLELGDVTLYDGQETTSGSLGDNVLSDVKGGTVVDENHSEHGNIFIDAGDGASKTDMANTLGHEVIETQKLQGKDSSLTGELLGENSAQQQEDLANAFGEQFADRINQASGGSLDSSGGTDFAHNLKNSSTVQAGTQRADNVGNAGVEHRQLYVAEAKAILDAAPAYAKEQDISEEQAKKDLTQQALLQVDKTWSEQAHIEENSEARAALANIAKDMGEVGESPFGRNLIDVLADTETSPAFEAKDEATYNDPNHNARETSQIEQGIPDGKGNLIYGFHEQYATANGEKPVDIDLGESAEQALEDTATSLGVLVDRAKEDPVGLMKDTGQAIVDGVVDTVTNPEQLVLTDSTGTAADRQLVAELQGNREGALTEASNQFKEDVADVLPPGVGKAVKGAAGEVVDVAAEQAGKEVITTVGLPPGDPEFIGPNLKIGKVNTESPVELSNEKIGVKSGHDTARSVSDGGAGRTLTGHGTYWNGAEDFPEDGTMFVPEGTAVTIARPGVALPDRAGQLMEQGRWEDLGKLVEVDAEDGAIRNSVQGMATHLPGAPIKKYTLTAPDEKINASKNSISVNKPTNIEDIIEPDQGCVTWAACTTDYFKGD